MSNDLKIDAYNHYIPPAYLELLLRHSKDMGIVKRMSSIRVLCDIEARVEGCGQRGQRPQREILGAAEDLADPSGRDAHPCREVSAGEAALAHVPADLVGQLRDEGEHLVVDLGFHSPTVWRSACSEAHQCLHLVTARPAAPDGVTSGLLRCS